MNQKTVAIIILNWNGKKDTLECLSSLEKLTYPHYEIILVDNGSSDNSVEVFKCKYPQLTLIETEENLGFAGGNNRGIEYALTKGFSYILLLNNDTVVAPNLLESFLDASSDGDILGAKLYLYSNPDTFDHFGGMWNKETARFIMLGNREKEDGKSWEIPIDLDYVCGAAMFLKKEVIETVGMLEPKFFLIWEENDFCHRARRAGFSVRFCPKAKVWHKVSSSFVGGKPHSTYFWWRGRLLWIKRNCTPRERRRLMFTVVFPEILHTLKLQLIKTPLLPFASKAKRAEKRSYLRKQRAALAGVYDYFLGRFGKGPSWLYKS